MLGVAARKTKGIDDGGGTASRFVHQQTDEEGKRKDKIRKEASRSRP